MSSPLSASGQIEFHGKLVVHRDRFFRPLRLAVASSERSRLDAELQRLVPSSVLDFLQQRRVDPALVFPTEVVLAQVPSLLAYYRLLLGMSKKGFYQGSRASFAKLEDGSQMSKGDIVKVGALCAEMALALAELVMALPTLTEDDLRELPMLTLGVQYDGARRVRMGQEAGCFSRSVSI